MMVLEGGINLPLLKLLLVIIFIMGTRREPGHLPLPLATVGLLGRSLLRWEPVSSSGKGSVAAVIVNLHSWLDIESPQKHTPGCFYGNVSRKV